MTQSFDLKPNNYKNLEEFLKVTVKTTRKNLRCDRVTICDASQLPTAEVIAESVDSSYASIFGKTIKDPFLEGEYLELYCYGQPVAIDNIDKIELSSSGLDDWLKLKAQSVAIAPITVNSKLLAFLVAHHYSQPQSWHPEAINYLTKTANKISFALSSIAEANSPKDSNLINRAENNQPKQPQIMQSRQNGKANQTQPSKTITLDNINSLLAEVNEKIAGELGQENILDRTVEELRQLLKCDRVVVYTLNQEDYGIIVAESVAPGWTSSKGKAIDDPCLALRYIEEYRNGRVRAINDVRSDKITPCYLEQLEEFDIRANLVAPIVKKDELFGLLIAHQCSDARNWQKHEIDWIREIGNQVGLLLEYGEIFETEQQAQRSTASDSKWNEQFSDAIQYIRKSLSQEDILKASVKEVRRVLDCDRVVVYSLDRQLRYGEVIAESVAPGWTRALNRQIDDPCFEPTYREKYRNGRVRAIDNIYEVSMTRCYIEQLEELEVKANLVAPIINEGELFGLLVAHQCSAPRQWQQPEIHWVTQIAMQVGFALDNAKLLVNAKQLQHQLESEAKLTKYFTDAVRYIRESLDREDILEVSVEEVRRVLGCDRVVVYSLNRKLRYGAVIAESVAPGWTRALNTQISDPCFEPTYREKYRNGRVRAIDNIYESGIKECYVEQLEELEIKANLVTPIINEGKLFGLLVAHQCSAPRQWQQPEIRWVTQIATQVGFALDNAKLLARAKQLRQQIEDESRWTEYFTDAIGHIRESLKTKDILKASVNEVRKVLMCDRVVVYSLNRELRYGTVIAESVAPGWTRALNQQISDPCFEPTYREKYRNGRVRAIDNIYESGIKECYIEQLEELEVKANLVTPIINEGKLFGLLVAHQCSDTRQWQQPEIRWVAQVATQVGFALDNAKLLEKLEQSTEITSRMSHQQNEQTEALKHQVVEILGKNGNAYQTLSQEAMRQSETTIDVLHQIQKVADSFNGIALNVQQVKFQEQQNDLVIQNTQESLNNALDNFSNVQRTVQNVAFGFDNLSNFCQQLAETVNTIKDLSKQIVQQSMSITRAVNRSQIDSNQNTIIDLSDNIFSLMQQLFEASAKVEPLFSNIKTEVKEKTIILDSGTQQIVSGVSEFQTVRQKLDRVAALNNKMNALVENISQSVENQTQSSTFAKNSVQEVASIAERISEQSITITQSFNQLVVLVQRL